VERAAGDTNGSADCQVERLRNVRAHGDDRACELMGADPWQVLPHGARGEDGVGMAIGRSLDVDEDVLALGFWGPREVLEFVGLVERFEDLCTHRDA
jgi:hypothetical protein